MRAQAKSSLVDEVSHIEKTLAAIGEDKEVVKLTYDQSKSAENSVGKENFLLKTLMLSHFEVCASHLLLQ